MNARAFVEDSLAERFFRGPSHHAPPAADRLRDTRSPPRGAGWNTNRIGDFPRWTEAGPGRRRCGGLKVRASLQDILLVKLCVMAHKALVKNHVGMGLALVARACLDKLRRRYDHISPHSLNRRMPEPLGRAVQSASNSNLVTAAFPTIR